jgi:hypothetical protein
MMKFSLPSTFIIPCSVFCGSLFTDTRHLKPIMEEIQFRGYYD